MTGWEIAVVIGVSVIGAFVQGSVGFGHNLIAAPVLALVDDGFVPGPAIASAVLLTGLMAWRDHRGLHLGEIRTAMIGRIPATLLAAATVALLPGRPLAVLFAILVLAAVAMTASGLRMRPTSRTLVGAGALSGFMATTTSIGGPPMAMLYANEEGRRMRGTLAGFFLIGSGLSLVALALTGSYGFREVALTGWVVPGVVIGFLASAHGANRLDTGHTRTAVLAVSVLGALSVLADTLLL